VRPVAELVTGIWSVSVTVAVVGTKLTVILQAVLGARVVQLLVEVKLVVVLVGVPIWSVAELVFVRMMFCCVAVGPGTLLKMRAVGLRETPGSGEANPVSEAVAGPKEVEIVTVPVREPVAVGEKLTLKKQEALGASWPVQAAPPVGEVLSAKSPVSVGPMRVMVDAVRFVRVKSAGALVLLKGTVPKSCVVGVRMRPKRATPVPVRVSGDGVPEAEEVRVSVAVCAPAVEGVNCTPSQQLAQEPVKVERKADVGGWPWPKPMSSTRMVLKSGAEVAAVSVVKDEVILYHCTVGCPMRTLPKARVSFGAVTTAMPVPLKVT